MTKKKNLFQNILCALFLSFPLIEIYRRFLGDTVSVCGIAVEELIPMLWACFLFFAGIYIAVKEKKFKILTLCGIYVAIFAVFLILHGMNVLKFNTAVFPTATPNFIVECYYLVRMYALPFAIAMSAFMLDLSARKITKTAVFVSLEISAVIIITNILNVSYVSYADEYTKIQGSIFSWFTLPADTNFALYTSKGFFGSANAIGALMFALTPIVFGNALKTKDKLSISATVLLGLSSVMLGTKVAMLGFALSLAAVLFAFAINMLFTKEYKKIALSSVFTVLGLAIYLVLLLNSPGFKMQKGNYIEKVTGHRDTDVAEIGSILDNSAKETHTWSEEEIKMLEDYMENKHYYHYVNEWFLDIYPVRGDMDFWTNIVSRDNTLNQSNRQFKIDIVNRIVSRNDNKNDLLFGIGYTTNVPYTERDYVYQYRLYGLCGLIVLIGPYFCSLATGGISFIKGIFKKRSVFETAYFAISVGAYLFIAYFAGHVFDILMNMYFSAIIAAMPIVLRINNDKE